MSEMQAGCTCLTLSCSCERQSIVFMSEGANWNASMCGIVAMIKNGMQEFCLDYESPAMLSWRRSNIPMGKQSALHSCAAIQATRCQQWSLGQSNHDLHQL